MELIYWEVKKLMSKKVWVMIIPIIIGIAIFFKINEYKHYDYINEEEYQMYQIYIDTFGGKISERTIDNITRKEKELDSIPQKVLLAKKELQNKEIDIEMYKNIVSNNVELQYHRAAINMIRSQIDGQEQSLNSEKYLINEYSWIDYFSQTFDFFWFFCLLTLTLIVFANLESKGKDELISSTYKGRSKMLLAKYVVSTIIFSMMFLLFEAMNVYVYLKEVNLEELKYPIQSIHLYTESSYMFSIKGLIVYSFLLKYIGSLSLVLFMSMMFIKIKKEVVAVFAIFIITIMIQLSLDTNPIFTLISFISLLTPQQLFYAQNGIQNSFVYNPIGMSMIIFISILFIVLVVIYIVNFKKLHIKKLKFFILGLLLLAFGCQSKKENYENDHIYNFQENQFVQENQKMKVFGTQGDFLFTRDGKNYYNVKNHLSFDKDNQMIVTTYLDENYIYYLEVDDNMMGYEIVRADLDGFSRTTIYNQTVEDSINFLNFLPDLNIKKEVFIQSPQMFFVYNNDLIEVRYNSIIVIDLEQGTQQEIKDFNGLNEISIVSNKLYYLNTMNEVIEYDLLTHKSKKVIDHLAESFRIGENTLYYINLENQDYLYKQNAFDNELLINQRIESFSLTNEGIYFLSKQDLNPYYYDFKSEEIRQLSKQSLIKIKGIKDGYYTYKYEDNRMIIEKCTKECEVIYAENKE